MEYYSVRTVTKRTTRKRMVRKRKKGISGNLSTGTRTMA